jgi:hypothetical protein
MAYPWVQGGLRHRNGYRTTADPVACSGWVTSWGRGLVEEGSFAVVDLDDGVAA